MNISAPPPERLSDLIRLAVHDIKLVADDKRYEIDMEFFHFKPSAEPVCYVCFAGAVMAKTLQFDLDDRLPHLFSAVAPDPNASAWCDAIEALDAARCGSISNALQFHSKVEVDEEKYNFSPADPHEDLSQFCLDMLAVADRLATDGL